MKSFPHGSIVAVVAAGGVGSRFGGSKNKQFVSLRGKPVLAWTIEALQSCGLIHSIIIVVHENEIPSARSIVKEYDCSKVSQIVSGGRERQDSVYNGLKAAGNTTDIVVVHDGARPLIDPEIISEAILELEGYDGTLTAVPVKDTIKMTLSGSSLPVVDHTLDRSHLWSVQTPQVFRYTTLLHALVQAKKDGFSGTDDASFVEHYGGKIRIISGSYRNIKITTPEDLAIAEAFITLPDRNDPSRRV